MPLYCSHSDRTTGRRAEPLTLAKILSWADEHFQRMGRWPTANSGRIHEAVHSSWANVDAALRGCLRGLTAASSLARLLESERGVRNIRRLANLSIAQILAWADAFQALHGQWPRTDSGLIPNSAGESWQSVESALNTARRGLAQRTTLAKLLAERRGRFHRKEQPPFSVEEILAWADRHQQRTGHWPNAKSGIVADAPPATWAIVNTALKIGIRGLQGDSSLVKLLIARRGIRSGAYRPPLDLRQIAAWAEEHRRRHGRWPEYESGPIPGSDGDTWLAVAMALRQGQRGLPGGSTLGKFLSDLDRAERDCDERKSQAARCGVSSAIERDEAMERADFHGAPQGVIEQQVRQTC